MNTKTKTVKTIAIIVLAAFCFTQSSWSSPIYKEPRNLREVTAEGSAMGALGKALLDAGKEGNRGNVYTNATGGANGVSGVPRSVQYTGSRLREATRGAAKEAAATPVVAPASRRVGNMNASGAQSPVVRAEAIGKKALVITDNEQFYNSVSGKIEELRSEGIEVKLLMLSGEGKITDSVAISKAKDEPGLDGVYTYLLNEASRNLMMSLGGIAYKELTGAPEEAVELLLSL